MNVSVIGIGYVGLVTGVSLAQFGHKVICVGRNKDKVRNMNQGLPPFYEPNLTLLLKSVLKKKRFQATTDLEKSLLKSDITIIAVGTPTVAGRIDLSQIKEVAKQVGTALKDKKSYHLVAIRSTVVPNTTEKVVKPILEKYSKKRAGEFGLCMNPEFLREGNAVEDALNPDRIVIGQYDIKSGKTFALLYKNVKTTLLFTNLQTAEMTKYAANALLATLISFSNEIARISEKVKDVDVLDVWRGVHLDKRLTPIHGKRRIKPGILSYILSGCGYGGSCFPKDTKALISFANEMGEKASLIRSVDSINKTQPQRIIFLLKSAIGKNLKNKKIAVLGLAFKPNTDDLRESPALSVIDELLLAGVQVICHDPRAYKERIPPELSSMPVVLVKTVQEAVKNTDAAIIITAWEEYAKLTPKFFKKHMRHPIIIDGRRIYDKSRFLSNGLIYKGIGYSGV